MFIFYLNLFFFFWLFSIFSYLMYNYTRIINYFLFILFILFILFLIIIFNKSIIWYQVLFIFYTLAPLQISYIIGIDVYHFIFYFWVYFY